MASTSRRSSSAIAIAGPRRMAHAPPPEEPTIPRGKPARALPPLDYDDDTRAGGVHTAIRTRTRSAARPRWRTARWFALGIALGALGTMLARDDRARTWNEARAWAATQIRSLERGSRPPLAATASPIHSAAADTADVAPNSCGADPSTDECAELLAPFADDPWMKEPRPPAIATPTVAFEDLPRVEPKPPARSVVWRARPAPKPASSTGGEPPDDVDDSNPYAEGSE